MVTLLRARKGRLMTKRFTGPRYKPTEYDEAYEFDYYDLDEPAGIVEFSAVLSQLEGDPFAALIRGVLAEGINPDRPVLRRIKAKGGHPIYFVEQQAGRWMLIDFDDVTVPADKVTDQERLDWLVSLLPVELHDVSFHYQMSSSARLPVTTTSASDKPKPETVSAHCFFWLATPRSDSALHEWALWINRLHLLRPDVDAEAVKKPKLVDPAVFISNQPNYTAAPIFDEGAVDPYAAGRRSGLVRRARDVVELVMPPPGAVARQDAVEHSLQREHYQGTTAPRAGGILPVGTSYAEKLAAIGAPSFNKPIMAAITTAVRLRGDKLDREQVKGEVRACVDANFVHERGGEMARYKSDDYLDEALDSAVARFGRSDMERIRDRLMFQERMREEARQRDAVPPFVDDESRLIEFNFLDDPCGSGKSFQFRDHIVSSDERHWLYAVDKIERIEEVVADLKGHHWRAGGIEVHDAYSGKLDDAGNLETVIGQLAGIRHKIDSRVARDGNYRSVTFVTHAAALMYPWHLRGWSDHALIIDEKPSVWFCDRMDVSSNFDILDRYFRIAQREGDRIHLGLSDLGHKVASSTKPDDFDRRIWSLLNLASRGRKVFVNRSGWDSRGIEPIEFLALTLPDAFAGFRQRWMAADNLSRSLLFRLWERRGVAWNKVSLPGARQRSTPLRERGAVFYFMKHGASFTRFTQPDRPVRAAAQHVAAQHDRVLYAVNERKFAEPVHEVFGEGRHVGVTPKQTGTERFKSFDVAFWGAAIQASQTESDLVFRETGMTRRELDLDREFDALNQFAFRTIARDYDSDAPFVIYAMSEAQADYLAERYDIAIAHVPDVVVEHEPAKGGRPQTVGVTAMTADEKRAYKAQKQRESRAKAKAKM